MMIFRAMLGAALLAGLTGPAAAAPADPLGSPMWALQAQRIFGSARVVFDPALHLAMPMIAENQHVFPLTLDARALVKVQRIVVFADLNPIPIAVDFAPEAAAPWLSLRIKLDQRTPVRVAALTADGIWHVAGAWVDAAGGGCSAPPVSRARGDWAQHLGELRGATYATSDGLRLRFSARHPMDTGLVDGIPAYNIETIAVTSGTTKLGHFTVYGSVAEDPAFTLLLPTGTSAPLTLALRDTNGLQFTGHVPASAKP